MPDPTTRDSLAFVPMMKAHGSRRFRYNCSNCQYKAETDTPQDTMCPKCGEVMTVSIYESKVHQLQELLEQIEVDEFEDTELDMVGDYLDTLNTPSDFKIVDAVYNYDNYEVTITTNQDIPEPFDYAQIADVFGTDPSNVKVVGPSITVSDIYSMDVPSVMETDEGEIVLEHDKETYLVEDVSFDEAVDAEFTSTSIEEKMIKVIQGGELISKQLKPYRKKRLTAKQKAALSKARKKAWSSAGRRSRALSMKKRKSLGL